MSLLLESIKVQNKKIHAWDYHKQRIIRSLKVCYGQETKTFINLNAIQSYVNQLDNKLYKIRLIYDNKSYRIEHHEYKIKTIKSLKLVYDNHITYNEKYVDRKNLTELYQQKEDADNILIVRDGLLTDSYYCNIALLKDDQWQTPKTPLLPGVMRQQLLDQEVIVESDIKATDITSYSHISLFNAIIDFREVKVAVENVS